MSRSDYAIVVGIRRYPRFGATELEAADLRGPDNDAAAIYSWLVDPAKGGVPVRHVRRIQSAVFPDPFPSSAEAQPTMGALAAAFNELDAIAAKNNQAGRGLTVGRRLYVYIAGHGFAPHLKQGAVFTAEATRADPANFFATDWLDALYARQYFKEYVLWMDSCMSFLLAVTAAPTSMRPIAAIGQPARLFTAFAARRPQEAVEKEMPDGQVHGVFTWTLLQALNGNVALEAGGRITTAGIKNYMISAMRTHLTSQELADERNSREPDFSSDDPMVFGTVPAGAGFRVVLSFPASAEGKPYSIMGERLRQVATGQATAAPARLILATGMYALILDGAPTTFQVVGDTRVDIG
jgi:uncharacterized caspase-like protein